MTEYYRFYNITKEKGNIYGLHPYYHIYWIKDVQKYNIEDMIKLFEKIIKKNEWNESDLIIAFGDNGTKFRYRCSTINEYNPTEEEYRRELELEEYFDKLDIRRLLRYSII